MKLWNTIKTLLTVRRKFVSGTLYVDGVAVQDLGNFKFQPDFHYTYLPHKDRFKLLCKLEYVVLWKKGGKPQVNTITCPDGFLWDGATIPKIFQDLIGDPFDPKYALASCIHDMAVRRKLDHYLESQAFYSILKTRKQVPTWIEVLMYSAVFVWSILSEI